MFERLSSQGFQIAYRSHAKAILEMDFPQVAAELEDILTEATVPIEEIISGGGGEAHGTQRLRRALTARDWFKTTFVIEKTINGERRESQSHEVDHVRRFDNGCRIALEIEWNNKDPFYDRDLENFKRLHADGAISAGIIITRGKSLHDDMRSLVCRFLEERMITDLDGLKAWGYEPTRRQRENINRRSHRLTNPLSFTEAFADQFVADKFGEATTHWGKLEDRLQRGVGNPCPLLLIGIPAAKVTFDQGDPAAPTSARQNDDAGSEV